MGECEVCGKAVSIAKRAEIDGVILEVCEDCIKLGKEVYQPKPVLIPKSKASMATTPRPESIESSLELVNDFPTRIKKAREKLNLTQDEAAMKIGISHLIYKRIEGGFKPDEQTARKIERFFGFSLYQ